MHNTYPNLLTKKEMVHKYVFQNEMNSIHSKFVPGSSEKKTKQNASDPFLIIYNDV